MGAAGSTILLTGATGYLGGVLTAGFLAETDARLVLPIRPHHQAESVYRHIAAEMDASTEAWRERVALVPLPPSRELPALAPLLRKHGVDSIVHAAGCVDYFNNKNLAEGNVDLTRGFVELGQELSVEKFAFVSTAFSAGYRREAIPESLHDEADEDPTDYTRSKRAAEAIVAASGLPYLIARPSIVIGDSRDGRYRGKKYGIYQLWAASEKILCVDYIPEFFAIAPRTALPLLHQDAFRNGFLEAYRTLPDDRVIHLVSNESTLPTVRDMWHSMLLACNRPRIIHYYDRLADVPMERLNRRQQMWIELTSVNLDISTRDWRFARDTLDTLCRGGLHFPDVTNETIGICQNRFIAESSRKQEYMRRFAREREVTPQVIEHA